MDPPGTARLADSVTAPSGGHHTPEGQSSWLPRTSAYPDNPSLFPRDLGQTSQSQGPRPSPPSVVTGFAAYQVWEYRPVWDLRCGRGPLLPFRTGVRVGLAHR